MSSNPKIIPAFRADTNRGISAYRIAIVGAGGLRGKEVAEVLRDRNFPTIDIKLLDEDDSLGQLESAGDEVTFIQSLRSENFEKLDFTFFTSDAETTRKNWIKPRNAGSTIIDLSSALENEPDAVVRSPWAERELGKIYTPQLQPGPAITAHPTATALALILARLQKLGEFKSIVTNVFLPASEFGQKGMDELHEQTVNLLSFQPLPKKIFDTQVAFNLVTRYGESAVNSLSKTRDLILRHYRLIAGENAAKTSLLVVQAPTFHGHAMSLHITLTQDADTLKIAKLLEGEHLTLTPPNEEPPNNVAVAGQEEILISIDKDDNDANSFWLWAASDNLRISACTAVECAETMAATRPRGQVQ
jgi:aspartate-semialdehyde dehydrogenase